MALTIAQIKKGKAAEILSDGRGLFLIISKTGFRSWRLRHQGTSTSLGKYPDITLEQARQMANDARKLIRQGLDPKKEKKLKKAEENGENRFKFVAMEWFKEHSPAWSKKHADIVLRRIEQDILPVLGDSVTSEIKPADVWALVKKIKERGTIDTAHRALRNCGGIFRHAVAIGKCESDPSRDLRGELPPAKKRKFAAVTDPGPFAEILKKIESYREGPETVRLALKLMTLLYPRPGALCAARWADINLDRGQWRYRVAKVEVEGEPLEHITPLPGQAVEIFYKLKDLSGDNSYVFPKNRTMAGHISTDDMVKALRKMGIDKEQATVHGFRATARTIQREILGFDSEAIELQLSHVIKDVNNGAYNRVKLLDERTKNAQGWADYLDVLKRMENPASLRRMDIAGGCDALVI